MVLFYLIAQLIYLIDPLFLSLLFILHINDYLLFFNMQIIHQIFHHCKWRHIQISEFYLKKYYSDHFHLQLYCNYQKIVAITTILNISDQVIRFARQSIFQSRHQIIIPSQLFIDIFPSNNPFITLNFSQNFNLTNFIIKFNFLNLGILIEVCKYPYFFVSSLQRICRQVNFFYELHIKILEGNNYFYNQFIFNIYHILLILGKLYSESKLLQSQQLIEQFLKQKKQESNSMQKQNKKIQRTSRKNSTSKEGKKERSNSLKKNEEDCIQQIFDPTQMIVKFKKIYQSKSQKQQLLAQGRIYADEIYQIKHNIKNLQDYSKLLKKQIEQLTQKLQQKQKKKKIHEQSQKTFFDQTPQKMSIDSRCKIDEEDKIIRDFSDGEDDYGEFDHVKTSLISQQHYIV